MYHGGAAVGVLQRLHLELEDVVFIVRHEQGVLSGGELALQFALHDEAGYLRVVGEDLEDLLRLLGAERRLERLGVATHDARA